MGKTARLKLWGVAAGCRLTGLSRATVYRRRNPPPLDAMDAALQAYVSEIVAMRREGLTRALSIEEAERVFTLAFALEQLYRNFSDLDRYVKEHADHFAGKRPA